MPTGRCHCGAIRYELAGEPQWSSLCHCSDCRRHSGAPLVGWSAFPESALKLLRGLAENLRVVRATGAVTSAVTAARDSSTTTPSTCRASPTCRSRRSTTRMLLAPMIQVQAAERIGWMERAHELPAFDRYPSRD